MSNTGPGLGTDPMKLLLLKNAGWPRMSYQRGWWKKWNEMKWMRWGWRNGGIKFVAGRNPKKNFPRPRFVLHETHMERPRRELGTPVTNRLCHETAHQVLWHSIWFHTESTNKWEVYCSRKSWHKETGTRLAKKTRNHFCIRFKIRYW